MIFRLCSKTKIVALLMSLAVIVQSAIPIYAMPFEDVNTETSDDLAKLNSDVNLQSENIAEFNRNYSNDNEDGFVISDGICNEDEIDNEFASSSDTTWQKDFDYNLSKAYVFDNKGTSGIVLCKYIGKESDLSVPSYAIIGGKKYYTILASELFANNSVLKSIDLSKLKNLNYIYTEHENGEEELYMCGSSMFENCTNLQKVVFGSLTVEGIDNMFYGCKNLKTVDMSKAAHIGAGFSIWYGGAMAPDHYFQNVFYGCSSLEEIDLSKIDFQDCYAINSMFEGCSSLKKVNLCGKNTENVSIMSRAFYGCSSLEEINLSGFNTKEVFLMDEMFKDCSSLKNIDLSSFDTKEVNSMKDMFEGCSSLTSLDLSGFDLSSLFNGDVSIFDNCDKLLEIRTPINLKSSCNIVLPDYYVCDDFPGKCYTSLPHSYKSYVYKRLVVPKDITLDKTSLTMSVGSTEKINVDFDPKDTLYENIQWSSSDESIVTVDKNGIVEGIREGNSVIYALWKHPVRGDKREIQKECNVTVIRPVSVSGIRLDSTLKNIRIGDEFILSANIVPENATNKNLRWSSKSSNIASVDNDGRVIGKSVGKTTITATTEDGGFTATCEVTVEPAWVESVSINKVSTSLNIDAEENLTVIIKPDNASNKEITWSSSDPSIVTVSSTGVIKGISVGKATITATATDGSGAKDTCEVTVTPILVSKITLSKNSIYLETGKRETFNAVVEPDMVANKTLKWTSSNDKVAMVDADGKVTAVAEGTAVITATSTDGGNVSATCKVTVVKEIVYTENISLSPQSREINVGDTFAITATVLPENATNKEVIWTTNNAGVAVVSTTGVVTGKGAGTAVITATTADGKNKAPCRVTVISYGGDKKNEEMNSGIDGSSITAKKLDVSKAFDIPTGVSTRFVIKDKTQKKYASIGSNTGIISAKKTGIVVVTLQQNDSGTWKDIEDVTYDIVVPKNTTAPCGIAYYEGQVIDLNELIKGNEGLYPDSWNMTSDSSIARVDSKTGELTVGTKNGTAKINAIYGSGQNARKVKINVKISHKKVNISDEFESVTDKKKFIIKNKIEKKIASINSKGLLTVKKNGEVTVTLQVKNGSSWTDVEDKTFSVTDPLRDIL